MITSLTLSDFQSHSKTELDFCEGVNAIVGKTDSGKSAIVRGLRLAIENRPSGLAFIRNGTDTAFTEINLAPLGDEAPHTVRRLRSKAKNQYIIDSVELKAISRGSVPDEVAIITAIDPSVNIQTQSSPYFLLQNTESERGKLLEKFCNISVAAQAVVIARRYALQWGRQATISREALAPVQRKLDTLESLPEMEQQYADIEALQTRLNAVEAKILAITELADKVKTLDNKLLTIKPLADSINQRLVALFEVDSKLAAIVVKGKALAGFQRELSKPVPGLIAIPDTPDLVSVLAKLNTLEGFKVSLAKPVPSRIEVPSLDVKKLEQVEERLSNLSDLRKKYTALEADAAVCYLEWDTVNNELKQWDSCPLCGQRITNGDEHVA